MKKLYALLFLALPFVADAQFSKGNVFLGGTLSAMLQNSDTNTSTSSTTYTNNSFGISPSIGFFLNEKIALGAAINYSTSLQKGVFNQSTGSLTQVQTNSVGINPYVRLYQPITSSIYFGLQGGISFTRGNSMLTNFGTTTTTPNYSVGVNFKPIFIFFPSPKWGVETGIGSLGYTYMRNLPDTGSTSTFGLSAGSFTFGVAYYFIKK